MSERFRLRLMLGGTLGVAVVVMLGLPLLLLLLPDPAPRPVRSIAEAGRGAYVRGGTTTWRLFPRADQLDALPRDAPAVSGKVEVVVAARQSDAPGAYGLARLGGPAVPSRARVVRERGLAVVTLEAGALAPGAYEVTMPRESMFGGTDFGYFTVSR